MQRSATSMIVKIAATTIYVAGVLLVISGVAPMGFAVGVMNHVADDPGIEGGAQLEKEWSDWAFSRTFTGYIVVGVALILVGIVLVLKPWRLYFSTSAIALTMLTVLVSACLTGWVLF